MRTVLAAALLAGTAYAAPPPGADPSLHSWFERQHSVNGAWCCDVSDGHVLTDDEWRADGAAYDVRIGGAWHRIPDAALRDPAGGPNPTGAAVVWYVGSESGLRIFCFAPGTQF